MDRSTRKAPPYFMYFPGNYRWSAAMLGMLSTARLGRLGHQRGRQDRPAAEGQGRDSRRRRSVVRRVRQGRGRGARARRGATKPRDTGTPLPVLSARMQVLPDGRALPHAQGRESTRGCTDDSIECFHRFAALTECRSRSSKCRTRAAACPATSCTLRRALSDVRRASSTSTAST